VCQTKSCLYLIQLWILNLGMSFALHAVNVVKELNLQELFSVHYNVTETGSIFCGYTFFDR
jgi:hypothetical protein